MAAMIIPIVAAALPEIVKLIGELIDYVKGADAMTPEQRAAKISELSARLDATNRAVQALEIKDV